MNKSTLAIMAILCLLLMACTKEEPLQYQDYNLKVQNHSIDNLDVNYANDEGVITTSTAIKVSVDYFDEITAYINSTSYEDVEVLGYGDDINISGINSSLILVNIDNVIISVPDISISVDGEKLSYTTSDSTVSGTGLSFIIEEDPMGI